MDEQNRPLSDDPSPAPEAGDRHAQFLALFLGSEKEVFRYISALVPCVTDAQDLVQQTALALWRKFGEYDPRQPFTPWACRFALLEVKEFLRRSRKWQALLEGDLADELVRRRESLTADLDRRLAFLAGCLDKLPSHQRAVVEGYYYERHSVESLATRTGRTVEAIYKSLQRIRQTLLECVTVSLQQAESQA
ncbi:MAG: sigma-70 family RNA polymerase sigma factor [Pirellulaceae bacterium]|jgi:RNA polymerase sigma-70 factor (ECF subfamily)|nr:sigma-70 family RNA polymerase sigma factor [Pirellulaceae bacterium]